MALTLAQLRTVTTRDDALEDLLTTLQALGFNTSAWQSGSVQRTLMTAFAQGYASMTEITAALEEQVDAPLVDGQGERRDTSVWFDLDSKRQDKADAKYCYVIVSMSPEAYTAEWEQSPTSVNKQITDIEFDWYQPDVVFVAEYYIIE